MSVSLAEHRLGGLRWIVLNGPDREAFGALGEHVRGVRSDPRPDGHGLTTLCTLVADLTAGEAIIAARDEPPVAIPLADLAEGDPRARRPFRPAMF